MLSWSRQLLPRIGSLLSGAKIQTASRRRIAARWAAVSGSLSRLLSTQVRSVLTTEKVVAARSRGTATQTLNNTSGDSSTQSAEGSPLEVRGSSPGPRISCTRSSVGRAPDPHTLSGGYPEVVWFESGRVLISSGSSSGSSEQGRALISVRGRVVQPPPPALGSVAQRSALSSDRGGRSHLPRAIGIRRHVRTCSSVGRALGLLSRGVMGSSPIRCMHQ